jgi:hypothetical protein
MQLTTALTLIVLLTRILLCVRCNRSSILAGVQASVGDWSALRVRVHSVHARTVSSANFLQESVCSSFVGKSQRPIVVDQAVTVQLFVHITDLVTFELHV